MLTMLELAKTEDGRRVIKAVLDDATDETKLNPMLFRDRPEEFAQFYGVLAEATYNDAPTRPFVTAMLQGRFRDEAIVALGCADEDLTNLGNAMRPLLMRREQFNALHVAGFAK